MNEAIEVVVFRAVEGVTDSEVRAAALAITPVVSELPGFISREFGASEDGQYVDLIRWKDMPSAKAAAETVMSIPQCGEFFRLIDNTKVQVMHFGKVE